MVILFITRGKFSTAGGQADVQMMTLEERLPYVNNAELHFESIDLPYADSNYALNIILPYAYQTIKNLIPKLKDISIHQIMEKKEITLVDVRLPKTKFNVGKSLIKTFKLLGVQDLFTDAADLSDLTNAKLQVSEILHNAEIEIQEAGTVATAATTIQFNLKSYRPMQRKSVLFNVNRPFIINIYNKKTSLNLFSGIVYKPEANP